MEMLSANMGEEKLHYSIHDGVSFLFSNEINDQLNNTSNSFDFSFALKIIISKNC